MSEWLGRAFSGGVSLERVNPLGIVLIAAALILNIAAKSISKRWPEGKRQGARDAMKLAALLLCCLGAAIAIF